MSFRRCLPLALTAALLMIDASGTATTITRSDDPSILLGLVRTALGGDQRLASVKTFTIDGRRTRSTWDRSERITISCELPDKFLVVTDLPPAGADDRVTLYNGFNGSTLIQRSNPPGKISPYGPLPMPTAAAQLGANRDEFTLLTLPLFAASFAAHPLSFSAGGSRSFGQQTADALDIRGPGRYALRMLIDPTTHLPRALEWTANGEFRLWIEDYRKEGDFSWPHRLRLEHVATRGQAGETRLEKFKINPVLKAAVFK